MRSNLAVALTPMHTLGISVSCFRRRAALFVCVCVCVGSCPCNGEIDRYAFPPGVEKFWNNPGDLYDLLGWL